MTRHRLSDFIALAGISALTNAAYATQPTCTISDAFANTACGTNALAAVNGGKSNSAIGFRAMEANVGGNNNTASGTYALAANTNGNYNTASGSYVLTSNQSGSYNTASGGIAMAYNISGNNNTVSGYAALEKNTSGSNNVAIGNNALHESATASYGSALGFSALINSQSGLANIGVGPFAGRNIVAGQLNIDIGSWGSVDESNTIRIGLPQYHLTTFISGIATSQVTGAPVYVTANGQLGVLASSERYKTDIAALDGGADRLGELRPVSFHLKTDPDGALQYGLIAEEVDKVYPELVIRDTEGRIQGVRYDELAPLLLNELQKERATIDRQAQHTASQDARIDALQSELATMRAALASIQDKDRLATKP